MGPIRRWRRSTHDRDSIRAAGAAHHSVPGHAAGPAVGPRQPSGNQALAWTNRPRRPG